MKVTLMMCLNQLILQLYQTYKNLWQKGSGWIIDSLSGKQSSYIKLPKELNHPKEGLININNIDDNEYFKWSMARYL